jgi:hypothetical protein
VDKTTGWKTFYIALRSVERSAMAVLVLNSRIHFGVISCLRPTLALTLALIKLRGASLEGYGGAGVNQE